MFNRTSGVIILAVLVICILVLLLAAIQGIDVTVTPGTTPTPSPTPTPTATQTPVLSAETVQSELSPPFTWLRDRLRLLLAIQTRFSRMLQAFLPGLLGILVVALAIYTFADTQRYRIELDQMQNGTADETFTTALAGIEPLAREKLVFSIRILMDTIKQYANVTSEGAPFPRQSSLPEDPRLRETFDKVVDALREDSPSYIKPLLSVWRYLFPGRGIRIRMTFQHDGHPASPVAITFEFINLGEHTITKVFTVNEEEPPSPKIPAWVLCPSEKEMTREEIGTARQPEKKENNIPWTQRVARALKRAYLYEDALTYYEKALSPNEKDQTLLEELVDCQNQIARRKGPATAFAAASRLEESKRLEAAAESYARIFREEAHIREAHRQWKFVFDPSKVAKGIALNRLAKLYWEEMELHEEAMGLYQRAVQEGSADALKELEYLRKEQADALVEASEYLLENEQWVSADAYLAKAIANVPHHPGAISLQQQLKANQPRQEDKEALAAFELGKIYLAHGHDVTAIEYFEKALGKQPDYTEAHGMLDEAMKASRSLRGRFTDLLTNAMDWLAVELIRQETDRQTVGLEPDLFRKAQYHNFYGAYLLALYVSFPSAAPLVQAELLEAIRCAPNWVLPYISLGELFTTQALNEPNRDLAQNLLRRAIASFDIALKKKVCRPGDEPASLTAALRDYIHVARGVAELLTCRPKEERSTELWKQVSTAECNIQVNKQQFKERPILREFEDLYSALAILYALVHLRTTKGEDTCGCPHPDKALPRVHFYLACGGCIETSWIWTANYHPVLADLVPEKVREDLVTQIEIIRLDHKDNPWGSMPRLNWQHALSALNNIGFDYSEDLLEEE